MIRARTVYLVADPFTRWREPLAELAPGKNGLVAVKALANGLEPDRYELHKPLAVLATLLLEDLAEMTNEDLIAGRRHLDLGPQAVFGDLVRVRYADNSVEDLDECAMVACVPGSPFLCSDTFRHGIPNVTTYKLMTLQPIGSNEDQCVYFHDGPRALLLIQVGKARGCAALIQPVDGGPNWDRVTVESWEDEARRLRHQAGHLAYSLRRWAGTERDLATQPPSAEKATTHWATKNGASVALDTAAGKIERSLAPMSREPRAAEEITR